MKVYVFALCVLTAVIVSVSATQVRQCSGRSIDNLQQDVSIAECDKPPCKLKKKTKVAVVIKLKPERDVPKVTNTVFAYIVGIPFPFIGVDQTNACGQIYNKEGKKVGCPLKAGEEYIYKNDIDVLEIYPTLKTVVHWAITASSSEDISCFEVPARIIN